MPDRRLIRVARQLQKTSTDAERRIWSYLRGSQIGGFVFRRQHPMGEYIVDFYCHSARLVVELDGAQHTDPKAVSYDHQRTASMEASGIKVIRFSNYDALHLSDAVISSILREVEDRCTVSPHPSPPPEYRERGF